MNSQFIKLEKQQYETISNKRQRYLLFAAICILCIGLALIFLATKKGFDKGEDAIQKNGGSLETKKYYLIVEQSIESYRAAGVVIALLGGALIVISFHEEAKNSPS